MLFNKVLVARWCKLGLRKASMHSNKFYYWICLNLKRMLFYVCMLLQVVNNECFDWLIHLFDFSLNENFLQERIRYENPHKAFTFRMHGYESVVGPVKGMYNQAVCNNKPRGHSLLTESRPNFITILALGTLLFHISFHRSWFLH